MVIYLKSKFYFLQLFYTRIYLEPKLRAELDIRLDHQASLFQNLNGEVDNVEVRFAEGNPYLHNLVFDTMPMILHGNGPSKMFLNTVANYIPANWHAEEGCLDCWRDNLDFKSLVETPRVLLAVFIEAPTPFMDEFWEKLTGLRYDKSAIDLLVHNSVDHHEKQVQEFVAYWTSENLVDKFNSVQRIAAGVSETDARNQALAACTTLKCDYLFVVDSVAHLDNPNTLALLIEQNRDVVAPLLIRPYSAWSNFWGSLSRDGFYARSLDYMDIVRNDRRGLWNVPFISACYLVQGSLLYEDNLGLTYTSGEGLDRDMALAASVRDLGLFMYVSNRVNFGHLVNNDKFPTAHLNNELWEMERNR